MHILLGVRVFMVIPVMGSPPQRPLLSRRLGQKGKDELEHTPCLKGLVRKVPMVSHGHRQHLNGINHAEKDKIRGLYSRPDHAKKSEMNDNKRCNVQDARLEFRHCRLEGW
jgi:hypothetical protein